jgi:hypothetical protein
MLIKNKDQKEKPSEYLKSAIKRSEDDIKNGRVYSFKNNREAINFLKDQ